LRYPSSFDIDTAARARFVGSINTAAADGKDVVVVAPTVGSKDGRAKMLKALRDAGLDPQIAAVLGWATATDEAPAAQAKAAAPAIASSPQVDPPTLDDAYG
jgi:orotate phosphoribosyltransferase-like protein